MKLIINKMPGVMLAAAVAVPAWLIGRAYPIIGSPVLGILFGMILAFWKRPTVFEDGIKYTSKKLLQYSIILLGFDMESLSGFGGGEPDAGADGIYADGGFCDRLCRRKAFEN